MSFSNSEIFSLRFRKLMKLLKIKWGISPTFTTSLRVPFVKSVTEIYRAELSHPAFSHFYRSMGAGHSRKKDANIGPTDTCAKVIACWNLREIKKRIFFQKAYGRKIILRKASSHAKKVLLALFRFLLYMCSF